MTSKNKQTVANGTPFQVARSARREIERLATVEALQDIVRASMIKRACRGDVTAALLLLTIW